MRLRNTSLLIIKVLLLFFIPFLFFQSCASTAEDIYYLHHKNGKELKGQALKDTIDNVYLIREDNWDLQEIPVDSTYFITKQEVVVKAPNHVAPNNGGCLGCRNPSNYFLEGSVVGMRGNKLYMGGEISAGFRIYQTSLGISVAGWSVRNKIRFPILMQVKYYPWKTCWQPFILFNAGYIYDQNSSKYNLAPTSKIFNEISPKMIGGGIGVDIPVFDFMSLTLDGGYRYLTVSNEIGVNTCDGIQNRVGYSELHTGYFRIGVSF